MNLSWRTISPLFAFVLLGLSIACGPVDLPTSDAGNLPDAVIAPDTSNLPCVGDKCGQCESDQDCTFAKDNVPVLSFRCHPDQLVCVECLVDGDCGTAGRCNPSTSECVACLADKHCTTGVCAIDGNFCVECLADTDCKSGHCDGNTNTCLGCIDDKECNDNNPCTIDLCGDSGCTKEFAADGQECDAGPCTLNDQCEGGKCVAGEDDPACDVCETDEACLVGEWCARDVGQCGDFEGLCSPKPTVCDELKATQVCGCDNKTYPSDCKAYGSGVNILHKGPCCPDFKCKVGTPLDSDKDGCVDTCGCVSSEDCGPGDFCEVPQCFDFSDLSGASDDLGLCKSCKLTGAVCGCDNILYESGCKATLAGTSVAVLDKENLLDCCKPLTCPGKGTPIDTNADGCNDTCGCSKSTDCGEKQVCMKSTCDSDVGTCVNCNSPVDIVGAICGCKDGDTYDNLCEAGQAGDAVPEDGVCCGNPVFCLDGGLPVDIDDDGCADGCSCAQNSDCGDTEYCAVTECGGGDGACLSCDTEAVCSCKGVDYDNACAAKKAGDTVSVLGLGQCNASVECKINTDCDEGSFCAKVAEMCDGLGQCQVKPAKQDCALVSSKEVCGCDGHIYSSECEANFSGVSVDAESDCKTSPSDEVCKATSQCKGAGICDKSGATCGAEGVCSSLPKSCEKSDPLVCGCGGTTYENVCAAQLDGASIANQGGCACNSADECALDSTFCLFSDNQCGKSGSGVCAKTFLSCDDSSDSPVCGCDNVDYGNACLAQQAGVSVKASGTCASLDDGMDKKDP